MNTPVPVAIDWLALSAASGWLVSLLKPLIEAIPALHPNPDPTKNDLHDGVIRATNVVISFVLVFLFALSTNQLTRANALNIVLYTLITLSGAQVGYHIQTRSGGSVGDSIGGRLGAASAMLKQRMMKSAAPADIPAPAAGAAAAAYAPHVALDGAALASQLSVVATGEIAAQQAKIANA